MFLVEFGSVISSISEAFCTWHVGGIMYVVCWMYVDCDVLDVRCM